MARKSALATWLGELDASQVRDVLTRRRDAADSHPRSLRGLADELATSASLKLACEELDRGCRDVLDAVIHLGDDATPDTLAERLRCTGKASRGDLKRALAVLRERALVWSAGDALKTVPGQRPTGDPRRVTPAPRAPRRVPVEPDLVEHAAVRPATAVVDGVTRLVDFCDAHEVGAGTRGLKRVAKALRVDEIRACLYLRLAYQTGLLAVEEHERRVLPTTASDAWRAAQPAVRLAALVRAWPRITRVTGRVEEVGERCRRDVLERYAELAPGEAFEHRDEVVNELVWTRPAAHCALSTEAVVEEAEALGLVALGALTSLGAAVLAGEEAEVAARFVPRAATTAHLRPDLTATVRGLPTRELSAVLDLCADGAEGGWQFTPQSVRRALDTGRGPDALLVELAAVAEHGVPRAVEQLVRDVAKRHGQVTVTAVACCVRAEDPALLAEIATRPSLAALGLRTLAPTVLASAKPAAETLALLRDAGYAPTAATADGVPLLDRVTRRRLEPPVRRSAPWRGWRLPLTDQELNRLAVSLVERERPRPRFVPPVAESRRMSAVRLLRDQSLVLRDAEVVLLAEALVTRTTVEIDVANGPRTSSKHVVTPVEHAAGNLLANLEPRGDRREFLVSHIRSVREIR
ncbi:helicase-associated domain-containing protein [Actinosynnema sp. NPDC020468]|uniref:helicase-associated domain-containing protein n=1 Tax=Actinosynnema sp. NPDC020468 TaxID=3154488 RepID=UPI003402B0C2